MQNEEFAPLSFIMIYPSAKFEIKILIRFCANLEQNFDITLRPPQNAGLKLFYAIMSLLQPILFSVIQKTAKKREDY